MENKKKKGEISHLLFSWFVCNTEQRSQQLTVQKIQSSLFYSSLKGWALFLGGKKTPTLKFFVFLMPGPVQVSLLSIAHSHQLGPACSLPHGFLFSNCPLAAPSAFHPTLTSPGMKSFHTSLALDILSFTDSKGNGGGSKWKEKKEKKREEKGKRSFRRLGVVATRTRCFARWKSWKCSNF